MGALAEYTLPKQPAGIFGKRETIPTEKMPVEVSELSPYGKLQKPGNTLDFIFDNLLRSNYASANTFDKLYDNLYLTKQEFDKEKGLPGLVNILKKQDWNLAESAWKGFTLEEKKTFGDLASKAGLPAPKIFGFVGDVGLDPLTYIPASWFKKAFQLTRIGKVEKALEKTTIGKAFIPGAGLPEKFYESKLFAKYDLANEEKKILDNIYELRKGLNKETREHLTNVRSLGYDPVATAKEIEGLVAEGKITVKDIYKLNEIAERFDELGQISVNKGMISQQAFDTWKDSYVPGLAKERIKLGSPDVIPGFFDKTSKGGFYTKHKNFRDIDDLDNYLKELGLKEGAEKDILKLLAYRDVAQARFLAKKKFVDLTLANFGESIPAGSVKIPPEGMGLYLPKGAIRIFTKEYLDPKFIDELYGIADKLQDIKVKVEKTTTTRTTEEIAGVVGSTIPSTGPRARMEGIVREALKSRGFTDGEASAYINILSTKGREGADDIVRTMTEKTDTIRTFLDSMPIGEDLVDLGALSEAQTKTLAAVTKKVPTYLLPKEIAKDMNKLNKYFIGDEAANKFIRLVIDKPLNVWKSMATSLRLPFHLRNMSSNWFLMYQGDVNPAMVIPRVLEAGTLQTGAMKEIVVNGIPVNKELLSKMGILGGHGWIGEQSSKKFMDELDSIVKYGRAKYFDPTMYPKEFGSFVENNARIGLFIDQLSKGITPEKASLHVKKYLFNYNELTDFERNVMKRVMPFYTWMRKNTPLQIEMLATKPGKFANVAKGLSALSGQETPEEKSARPEYFDDMGYKKAPDFLNLRSETGQPIYFNIDIPHNDLNMFDRDLSKTFKDIYSSLTPQKMLFEIMGNVKGFPKFGQIEKFQDQRVPAPSYIVKVAEYISEVPMLGQKFIDELRLEPIIDTNTGQKVMGMRAKWKYAVETAFPVFSEMGKMYPQPIRLEEENAPWRKWSYMLGVKVVPLNMEMANKMKQIEKMGKANEFMKLMQNIGRSPTPKEFNEMMKELK